MHVTVCVWVGAQLCACMCVCVCARARACMCVCPLYIIACMHTYIHVDDISLAKCKLKLTFRKYPSIHTNYIISHSTIFYNIIIIFDTTVTQKRNIEHEKQ